MSVDILLAGVLRRPGSNDVFTHTTTTLDMGACRPFVDDSTLKPGIVLTRVTLL